MTIVIPMAGLSSRFTKAGYTLPKYMLYVVDKSLFYLAVRSFEHYFQSCRDKSVVTRWQYLIIIVHLAVQGLL